jgi:hypothetical protein
MSLSVDVTFYDPVTGEIFKTIRCPSDAIEAQRPSGSEIIEGQFLSHEWRIVDGLPVSKNFDPSTIIPNTVIDQRRNRYPPVNEQVGAIMDWLELQRGNGNGGQPLTPELVAILDKIKAVKETFPKDQS